MSTHKLRIPEKITVHNTTDYSGKFTIKPLEQGFGHAIGNALRRVLLSSIEGYAITHFKLPQNVKHLFDTLPGMTEDINIFILNLKQVAFKSKEKSELGKLDTPEQLQQIITIEVSNKEILCAKDLVVNNAMLEVCNPEHILCHLDESAAFTLELIVQKGRGYNLATEENLSVKSMEGYENIDALFSPVKNVAYKVKDARVEGRVDYEALEIVIETDGSITSKDAIEEASYYLIQHFNQIVQKEIVAETLRPKEIQLDTKNIQMQGDLFRDIGSWGLSPRAYNVFRAQGINNLSDVVQLTLPDLKKYRNFGAKTVKEVKDLLESKGMYFGMNISKYKLQSPENETSR